MRIKKGGNQNLDITVSEETKATQYLKMSEVNCTKTVMNYIIHFFYLPRIALFFFLLFWECASAKAEADINGFICQGRVTKRIRLSPLEPQKELDRKEGPEKNRVNRSSRTFLTFYLFEWFNKRRAERWCASEPRVPDTDGRGGFLLDLKMRRYKIVVIRTVKTSEKCIFFGEDLSTICMNEDIDVVK